MLRTQKEWFDFCQDRGTSGDQVFDILKDWKESEEKLLNMLYNITDIIEINIGDLKEN